MKLISTSAKPASKLLTQLMQIHVLIKYQPAGIYNFLANLLRVHLYTPELLLVFGGAIALFAKEKFFGILSNFLFDNKSKVLYNTLS